MYSLVRPVNRQSGANFYFFEGTMNAVASQTHFNQAQSNIAVKPSTPVIGAEIEGVDLSKPLTSAEVNDIHQALLQWKVLFFRGQPISDEDQLRFGRYFG